MKRFIEAALRSQPGRFREEIERELLKLLFATTPVVLATNLINGTLVAVVFFRENAAPVVAIWWMFLLAMVSARAAVHGWYRRSAGYGRWGVHIAIIGSGMAGVLWGTAGLLFYSSATETERVVLAFVLGGMGAGAVAALTPCLPAFYAYLFPSVVPFCVRLMVEGDLDHLTMSAMCILYVVALVILGQRANMWLTQSVSQRFDNADLIGSLERRVNDRTAELREVNEQLEQDIAERKRAETALADYGHRQAAMANFGQIALSQIDIDTLFSDAVVLVRDRLAVARVVVIERSFDARINFVRGDSAQEMSASSLLETNGAGAEDRQRAVYAPAAEAGVDDDAVVELCLDQQSHIAKATISGRDRPFGVLLAMDVSSRRFSENDTAFLQSIANMLAAAIERKRAEDEIQQLALQDPLTGLPNRSLFRNELHQELARASRYQRMLAVLLLDLDHFKDVNDTLGHPTGDRLLAAAAARLKACLRETDTPARLGGDEFAVILPDLRSPEDAAAVARKLVARLSEPFPIEGHELHIGASIGITISPSDAEDVDGLLKTADLALYRAKMDGRHTYKFYATYMGAQVEARKTIENDLRQALKRDELFLEYQPQFDLATNRLAGAEALLRWRHPNRGVLPPDEFVPIAEATGLIIPLGRWVLERVAAQMQEWKAARLPPIVIAVNISLSQCRRGDLIRTIEEISTRTTWDLRLLELEVTEQMFLAQGMGDSIATLRHLSSLGVTISIDDFGTGYSSLGRLQRLPVDKVKIDRSFVAELGCSRDAEMIVRAIIALARSLRITVTAEGVENDRQIAFLAAEGCDYAQGYHLSLPLARHELAAMLRTTSVALDRSAVREPPDTCLGALAR